MSMAFNGSHYMSVNLTLQTANIDRTRRWRALGQHGATIWFTGLPGAGKTTIATEVEARLLERAAAPTGWTEMF